MINFFRNPIFALKKIFGKAQAPISKAARARLLHLAETKKRLEEFQRELTKRLNKWAGPGNRWGRRLNARKEAKAARLKRRAEFRQLRADRIRRGDEDVAAGRFRDPANPYEPIGN